MDSDKLNGLDEIIKILILKLNSGINEKIESLLDRNKDFMTVNIEDLEELIDKIETE